MQIVVSYLSSLYDRKKTIDLINDTDASGIHVDLIDGVYVGEKNFDIDTLPSLFADNTKPLDIHLMVDTPSSIIDVILKLNPVAIYIHPSTEDGVLGILSNIASHEVETGIAINPDEDIDDFAHYFPYVKRVLLMSVYPGKGGQAFIPETTKRLEELKKYQSDNNFTIYVDGGINDETIKQVSLADGVVCGSFICNREDFQGQIEKLKGE